MREEHLPFLREAIELSRQAMAHGDEPFGALLVRDGVVLLRAENTKILTRDKTNHAEMNLARAAMAQYDADFLKECTVYASTEPCVMCAGALYWAGIRHVVYACSEVRLREITGGGGFRLPCREVFARAGHPVEVIGPLLEDEALDVHRGYW